MGSRALTRDRTPGLPRWERGISAAGPPGKSQALFLCGLPVTRQLCSRPLPEFPVLSILSWAPRPCWPSGSLADAPSSWCPRVTAVCLPLLSAASSLTGSSLWAWLIPLGLCPPAGHGSARQPSGEVIALISHICCKPVCIFSKALRILPSLLKLIS